MERATTLEDAYRTAREHGVVVERPDRGLVRLTGPQRIWFLENTVTNKIDDVEEGRWTESCFLQLKGKVLAHFRVGILSEEIFLDVDPPGTGDLVDWFVRYRFRTKVEIEDRSGGCFTVVGPEARRLAEDGEVRKTDGVVTFGGSLGGVPTADVHAGRLPEDLSSYPRAGEELYETLRIEAGVGRFGVDYGPSTLPQEAGLTPIVSVTKGCYVGQEVMARLHFRGHVNRVLRPLSLEGVEQPDQAVGSELTDGGQRVGTITSVARSPQRGPVAVGMVRVVVPEGEWLDIASGGRARVGPIPEGTKVTKG